MSLLLTLVHFAESSHGYADDNVFRVTSTQTEPMIQFLFCENTKRRKKTNSFPFKIQVFHLSGMRLPAKFLIENLHRKNQKVDIHLDGAQNWGAFKHDLKDINCDSYNGGSHKWFLGPKETGILYMKRESVPNFWPKDIGYNGGMQPPPTFPGDPLPDDASGFEMVGQRNDTNLIGLLYTVDLMDLIGFDKIEKRVKSLTERLRGGLDEVTRELHNVFLVLTIKFRDEVGTGGARRQGKSQEVEPGLNEVLYYALYEHHHIGVSTKKGNRMRFSPHIYNMEEHIDRAVEAVRYELKKIRPR